MPYDEEQKKYIAYTPPTDPRPVYRPFKPQLPSQEWLDNLYKNVPQAWQIGNADEIAMRRIGYVPSYFEHPQNVALEWNKLQTLQKGQQPPEWINADKLNEAYQYFKYANEDKPWTEWKYLNPDDKLGRELVQSLGTPPVATMSPQYASIYSNLEGVQKGELNWADLAPDVRQQTLADPNFDIAKYPWEMRPQILSDSNFDWSRVPAWQKFAFGLTSNPKYSWIIPSLMAALPAGMAGAAVGGPPGAVIGVGAGLYAGYRAAQGDYDYSQGVFKQPTFIGGVFAGLNILAEEAEKTLGLITQLGTAAFIPEHAKDFQSIKDLFTAYEAGLGFYEQIPTTFFGKDIIIGRKEPIDVKNVGEYWLDARRRIEAGENYRMVAMEAQQYIGAQGTDFAMQMFGDPLNLMPYAQKHVTGKILEVTGHPTAAGAMLDSSGMIEGIKTYGTRVQTGAVEPGFKYNEMNGLERTLAGITLDAEGNPIIRAGKFAGTGLLEAQKKGFVNYLSTLQPESRARVGLGMASENITAMMSLFDTPDELHAFWTRLRGGDYTQAAELGARFLESPEHYTIMPAIKNYTMDEQLAIWNMSGENRMVVERIAEVLKRTGQDIVNDLSTPEKAAQTFETLRSTIATMDDEGAKLLKAEIDAGTFTADDLVQAGKIFNGESKAPLTVQQWKAQVAYAMSTHFENWAVDFFKLEPDSKFFRAAHMLKSAQSLLLLGFNPKYLVNNVINNMVSRIATGNFGYMTPKQIAAFIDDFGIQPFRLKEGVGMVGEVHQTGASGNIITDALRAEKGTIAAMDKAIKSTGNKIGIMSNLSRFSETVEGANAYTIGIKRAYNKLWKVGKGITRMDRGLEAAINKVYPGASELMYRAIEAGMNKAHIESIISGGIKEIYAKGLVTDYARKYGLDPTQSATMIDELYGFGEIDKQLKWVTSEADIRRVFDQIRKKSQDNINVRMVDDFKTRVEHTKNLITNEGWKAVHDTYIDVTMKYHEDWRLGFDKLDDAFTQLDLIEDPTLRSTLLENTYKSLMSDWDKTNAYDLSAYKGMAEAMGMGELPVARDFLARKARVAELFREAFQFRLEESQRHTDKYRNDWTNKERWDDWASTQDRVNKKFEEAYQAAVIEETAMGKLFEEQFTQRHGDAIGALAGQFWKEIMDFRDKMWAEQKNFRNKQRTMPAEQRKAAATKFWHERYPELITELEHMKIGGSLRIDDAVKGKPVEPIGPVKQGEMPGTPAPEKAPIKEAIDSEVYKIASEAENPVTSALPDGSVDPAANNIIVAIVRKYGGLEGKKITEIEQLSGRGDLIREAFRARDEAKKLQMALELEPEAIKTAIEESEKLEPPSDKANEASQKILDKVVEEPAAPPNPLKVMEDKHITDMPAEVRDALKYKLWDMRTSVENGEPGKRMFNNGEFIGVQTSSYPDWYGPLRSSKKDVLFALQALEAGLDKPEQALYRTLKSIALEDLKYDPALLDNYQWAKALGMEGEMLYMWEGHVKYIELELKRDLSIVEAQNNFEKLIELANKLPQEAADTLMFGGEETYGQYLSRVWDEADANLKSRDILETLVDADKAEARVEAHADALMTREVAKEKLVEIMGLTEEMADAKIAIMDAQAEAWSKWTGKTADAWWQENISKFVRGGEDTPGALFQQYKGAINFTKEGAIIHALDGADFSTAVHEIGGHLFPEILRKAVDQALPEYKAQLRADLKALEEFAGIKNGEWDPQVYYDEFGKVRVWGDDTVSFPDTAKGFADAHEYANRHREKLAKAWERYMTEGVAPTPALVRVFERMKQWMLEVYKSITGISIDVNLTDEVRRVFDRMLGQEQEAAAVARDTARAPSPAESHGFERIRPQTYTPEFNKGRIEGAPGSERLFTGTGREIDLPPSIRKESLASGGATNGRKINADFKKINQWLIAQAIEEAKAHGDDFNLRSFEHMDIKNLSKSDTDSMNYYLFGVEDLVELYQISKHNAEITAKQQQIADDKYAAQLAEQAPPKASPTLFQTAEPIETTAFKNWFGESQILDEYGRPKRLYHQTAPENVNPIYNEGFDLSKVGARGTDPGIPDGIFMKSRDNDIGVGAVDNAAQVEVYARIENPFIAETRKDLDAFLNIDKVYKDLVDKTNKIDVDYAKIFDALEEEHRNTLRSDRKKFTSFLDQQEVLVDKWRDELLSVSTEARARATKLLKDAGYDGVIIGMDEGSFGRKTDTYIAFEPTQVKSTKNRRGYDRNKPGIMFQSVDPRASNSYEQAAQWLPEGERLQDAYGKLVEPLLNGMEEEAVKQFRAPKFETSKLDADTQASLGKYLNQKKGEMATSKLASVRYGESMRDFALLNYNRRYGFDKYLDVIAPYQFWYTRTMLNWAMRALDKPAFFSNYARLNMMQNKYQNDLPERFRGKIGIPAPWLPDWMGDEIYIDPKKSIFPFANMLTPFETMARDRNYQQIETERVLQEWAQDETYSQTQIADAAANRSGAVWEKAVSEAKIRRESDISNPLDFMSVLLGPAWYLSMPAKALGLSIPYINPKGGGPETIGNLPITSTARAAEAVTQGTWAEPIGELIGLLGKPEEWLRKKTGLPEFGEYGDYYVKRQIANMVVDGLITVEEAEQAMLERSGEIYDQARQRVELELAMRIPGASATYAALNEGAAAGAGAIPASIFGGQILPAGELEYRGQKVEWDQAWKAADAGDETAIENFFNKYPEYEAYLAKGKDESELLRSFLRGQVWDNYMAMSDEDRRIITAQMPDLFRRSFLDEETRSYDSIDTPTLAMWARIFKGTVPETAETEEVIQSPQYQMPDIMGMPAQLQQAMDEYNLQKQQLFPGINDIQSIYFAVPEGRRRKVLGFYPELLNYWEWRRSYLAEHPEVAQFMDEEFTTAILNNEASPIGMDAATAQKLLRYYRSDYVGDPIRTYDSYFADVSPTLKTQFTAYVLKGTEMGQGAYRELYMLWEAVGKPQGSMQNWIKRVLIPTMP